MFVERPAGTQSRRRASSSVATDQVLHKAGRLRHLAPIVCSMLTTSAPAAFHPRRGKHRRLVRLLGRLLPRVRPQAGEPGRGGRGLLHRPPDGALRLSRAEQRQCGFSLSLFSLLQHPQSTAHLQYPRMSSFHRYVPRPMIDVCNDPLALSVPSMQLKWTTKAAKRLVSQSFWTAQSDARAPSRRLDAKKPTRRRYWAFTKTLLHAVRCSLSCSLIVKRCTSSTRQMEEVRQRTQLT